MKIVSALVVLVVLAAGSAVAGELPTSNGRKLVATVQGEPITLDELSREVAAMRRAQPPGTWDQRAAELAVLNRMINVVLIAQEGARMGISALPEVRKTVDTNARITLRDELVERIVKDVKADPKEVEATYQAAVREWKVSALLFTKEEHARDMVAELAAGKTFGELATAAMADGRATKVEDGVVLKRQTMEPAVAAVVARMAVGATSPVISTKSGPVVLTLQEIRHPEDPTARATAERVVLGTRRREAVAAYDQALRKKYVKVNADLLRNLDYEAEKPGIDALLKDRRVVAEVRGEPPVTVGELTEALKFQFFHGTSLAAASKRLNSKKEQVLDGLLHRKVFRKEALRLGLDKTDAYRDKVKDFERSVLFEAVVRKAVVPDVRLREDDIKAYYDEHRKEYTAPQMMRLRSLAFRTRESAESAAASLLSGADFQWVADHADDQLGSNAQDVVSFDGRPIMTSELPEAVQKAVAGARARDVRIYASPEKYYYVLAVENVVAAQPQPYEEVRQSIARKVLDAKIEKAVDDYADRLRALSDVKIYLGTS